MTFKLNETSQAFLIKSFEEEGIRDFKLELLYRATRDSFKNKVFKEKCFETGPTLTLIRTEYDRVLACFTSIPWKVEFHQWVRDPRAFICSIDNLYKSKCKDPSKAIYHSKKDYSSIAFGGNSSLDLFISNDCINITMGHSFKLPKGIKKKTSNSYQFFIGSDSFFCKLKEVECYRVVYSETTLC